METNQHLWAVIDDTVVKVDEATLPISSTAVQYAFSVYESVRVCKSHVVYAKEHIDRLFSSAKGIGLIHRFTSNEIITGLENIIKANSIISGTIRIVITGGDPCHCFITSAPLLIYPDSYYSKGISLSTYRGERFLPQYKTSSLLMNYLALREAKDKGSFEALLIDRRDFALEGTRSNFFGIKGDTFYSARDEDILEGVTRSKILEAIVALGYSISYTPIEFSQLFDNSFDGFFISSTSMGALPVASIDSQKVPLQIEKIHSIHTLIRQWEIDVLP
jgi:branched-subunit amino acid aminotransferase/4-amino-4-deoxychorismate lyase